MTTKPFLVRYERRHQEEQSSRATYDPVYMLLMLNGRPAILDPEFEESGSTLITKIRQETRDDQ